MIYNVLVICGNTKVSEQITGAVPDGIKLRIVSNFPAALSNQENRYDLIFIDIAMMEDNLPGQFAKVSRHFADHNPMVQYVILAPRASVSQAVELVNHGADSYLVYPIDNAEIELVLKQVQESITKNLELAYLRDRFWKPDWLEIIKTGNPTMRQIFENVHSVAATIATILLLGETGTGKGLMARLIHQHSHRSEGPLVTVHCGAIPDTLLESELFGHEKGAFTGATQRKLGKFELAKEGTIFLDEIGTISAAAQVKLLQLLHDGTFSRIGGTEALHTNARIIAATNADLGKMVAANQFRNDLFYRLNIFPIEIPPLKDRIEDLPHLIHQFLAKLNTKYQKKVKGLFPGIQECLQTYNWPGNLRELENVLERAIILEKSDILKPEHFPPTLTGCLKTGTLQVDETDLSLAQSRQKALGTFERNYLTTLLTKYKGNVNLCAQKAGVSTRQLSRLAAKYGLVPKTFRH